MARGIRFAAALLTVALHAPETRAQPAPGAAAQDVHRKADDLDARIVELYEAGRYADAIPLARQSLEAAEKTLGSNQTGLATKLNNLAELLDAKGDYAAAEPLFRRALAIREKARGPDHPEVAMTLNNLATLLQNKADYAGAEPLFRRALSIREKALGPDASEVGESLNNLAMLLQENGDYPTAETLCLRALAILEKNLGPDHATVAATLNNVAVLRQQRGDYSAAEPLFRRALEISEKALGPYHPEIAKSLYSLALLLVRRGEDAAAEPLFRRALTIWEDALGLDHPHLPFFLNGLAGALESKGDFAAAEPLFRRALAVAEKALGPDHPEVAMTLNNLAALLWAERDLAGAEPLYRRSSFIYEKVLGRDHPYLAFTLDNLAILADEKGDQASAEPLHRRALAIREKVFGPEHPLVASSLHNLAVSLHQKGDYRGAEPLYRRALAIREKLLGPDHPDVASSLRNLSLLLWAGGEPGLALPLLRRAAAIGERNLASLLATGSERQKQAFLERRERDGNLAFSLHVGALPDRADAARLALTVVLQRKGRVIDAVTDTLAQIRARGRAEDQQMLAQVASLRSELATRTLRGPAALEDVSHHEEALAEMRADLDDLEQELAGRYGAIAERRVPVTLPAVQTALAADVALAEIVMYEPIDPRWPDRAGDPRYVAYILRRTGEPAWVDLGPAAPIHALIAIVRRRLGEADPRFPEAARALDEKVMRPVRRLLGDAHDVYLSPDGELNLVPFAALVDERGQLLLSRYRFTYLTSGRDLLRLEASPSSPSRSPALVLGSPAFDEGGPPPGGLPSAGRSTSLDALRFDPLPATELEARQVAKTLPNAHLLLGKEATEGAVKVLAGPSILHLATHGFFLHDAPDAGRPAKDRRAVKLVTEPIEARPLREDSLLRSGLALAGANVRRRGPEDGVLTALEVAGLDLSGTKLVVLSACDTALGDLMPADGVYGLRRALVLAGSETQMMSLWKVHDEATRTLMTAYYERLNAGAGRSDALREVQIQMARDMLHPFYWAAFIVSGSGRTLAGKEPAAVREVEIPSAADAAKAFQTRAGCGRGCNAPGTSQNGGFFLPMAAVGAAALRRRAGRRSFPRRH